MRVRDLIPYIDEQQEIVIRASDGGKTIAGTASLIRHKQNVKEVKDMIDKNIDCVYYHCWKMFIMVEVDKEM